MSDSINVVFLGDVVGEPGRKIIKSNIENLKEKYNYDLLVINAENSAGGRGVVPKTADEIFEMGADIITLGDHTFDDKKIIPYLDENSDRIIRPANYNNSFTGKGCTIIEKNGVKIGVANLMGRVFMNGLYDCPFVKFDSIYEESLSECDLLLVDFHAEATSEKITFGRYLTPRASLVVGTHTHVPTADHMIIDNKTGYVSDIGMCGSYDNVLGMDYQVALSRFIGSPKSYKIGRGEGNVSGVFAKISTKSGNCLEINRIWV